VRVCVRVRVRVCVCVRVRVCVCVFFFGGEEGGSCVIPPYTAIQAKEESTLGLCELPLVVINNTEFQFKTSRSSHALPILHPSLHHYLTLLTQLQIRSTCSFCDSSQHRRHH
jgi:hypothetical protein